MSSKADSEKIQNIVMSVKAEENRLRHKYALLNQQDSIGLIILLLSLFGMFTSAVLY